MIVEQNMNDDIDRLLGVQKEKRDALASFLINLLETVNLEDIENAWSNTKNYKGVALEPWEGDWAKRLANEIREKMGKEE